MNEKYQYTKDELEMCTTLLHYRIQDYNINNLFPFINQVLSKCRYYDGDDIVELVFRNYILSGKTANIHTYLPQNKLIHSNSDVIDTLVYRQSNDPFINITAKLMYWKYGHNKLFFLEWQLDKLLSNQVIVNIKEEFEKFKKNTGINDQFEYKEYN